MRSLLSLEVDGAWCGCRLLRAPTLLLWGACCLATIHAHALDKTTFVFNDVKQGEYAKSLHSYEIAFPRKVTHDGEFLSHQIHHKLDDAAQQRQHHRRRKRETVNDEHEDRLHYKLLVEGNDLHLSLTPNDLLFAPGLVVELWDHFHGNMSDVRISRISGNDCHFVGDVKENPGSAVAISTCNGLHGLIRTQTGEYFVEPIRDHLREPGAPHPHLVYRRSAPNHPATSTEGECGVTHDDAKSEEHEREFWEKSQRRKRDTESASGRRHKRSISIERNVETLVVVDPMMMEYFKDDDIKTYVFVIMNMVSSIFHDKSIKNAVNIMMVRLLLIEKESHPLHKGLKIEHHAHNTLNSFCKWQVGINTNDEKDPNHHDVAILLTRNNICSRTNAPCSTLGLSQVSGMCQPHRSCNINEDTGLALAYTVAHEIGHNFGMQHDEEVNGCAARQGELMHVMAPVLSASAKPLIWSNCSQRAVTNFLDRDWGYCLNDEPTEHAIGPSDPSEHKSVPPGVMYNLNHQCRLQYGPEAAHCEGIDNVCQTLWCQVNNKCMTRLEAAAQGTICDENKWCQGGDCVPMGERPTSIDGEWGQWAGWTSCSRTCGAGVSFSERHCNNPPPSGNGQYCLGERKRYRICNTESCEHEAEDFRRMQCEEFNSIPYKGNMYEWEPVTQPDSACQLHCKPRGHLFSVMLRDSVTDGTQCRLGRRNMCISGRCRHIGCDWVIDSNAIEDACGVCHGDDTTCKMVKSQFNTTMGLGYVEAMVIPSGARNIEVMELGEASNYLAVSNDKGQYYLNGHWFIQWSGEYPAAGTVINYERQGNKEKFSAPGPLEEPLHIMLLFQSRNPGVHFEFTVPKENVTDSRPPVFHWEYLDWTHCTVSCGGGYQRSQVVCREKELGLVDDVYCNISSKPDDMQRTCNDHLCPARWWVGPWQHCSRSCGHGGVHRRTVLCVRKLGPDEQIALDDYECAGHSRPLHQEECHRKEPCPDDWITEAWSETCNNDPCQMQRRDVHCHEANALCDPLTKPTTQRPCDRNITCGHWSHSDWSPCARTCGKGTQFRSLMCKNGQLCRQDLRPLAEQNCNLRECPDIQIIPAQSGRSGRKHNNIHKSSIDVRQQSDDPKDKAHSPEGAREAASAVSSNSGGSQMKSKQEQVGRTLVGAKSVTEKGVVGETPELTNTTKEGNKRKTLPTVLPGVPETTQHYRWVPMFWQKCSVACGSGMRNRSVMCVQSRTMNEVEPRHCKGTKPAVREVCRGTDCLSWTLSEWSQCSVTCGTGQQIRDVTCFRDNQCDENHRPDASRSCDGGPCLAWVPGPWSECSVSCGTGEQYRHVQCVDLLTQQSSPSCDVMGQPETVVKCNEHSCDTGGTQGEAKKCSSDVMSKPVCKALRRMGQCRQRYVQVKCCRTCRTTEPRSKEKPQS